MKIVRDEDIKFIPRDEWIERYNNRMAEHGHQPEPNDSLNTGMVAWPDNPEGAADSIHRMLTDPNHPANRYQGKDAPIANANNSEVTATDRSNQPTSIDG